MKYRRQHAALRGAPWISQRKIHFQIMLRAFLDFPLCGDKQSLNVVRKSVDFRRHSRGSGNLNQRPARKLLQELVVIEFQSAYARRKHLPSQCSSKNRDVAYYREEQSTCHRCAFRPLRNLWPLHAIFPHCRAVHFSKIPKQYGQEQYYPCIEVKRSRQMSVQQFGNSTSGSAAWAVKVCQCVKRTARIERIFLRRKTVECKGAGNSRRCH